MEDDQKAKETAKDFVIKEEKQVDESWKERAKEEPKIMADEKMQEITPQATQSQTDELKKETQPVDNTNDIGDLPEVNFINYITSLAFQVMIFLGEIPSPLTNKVEKNLKQAKFIIDTLSLIKEKTAGNLSAEEENILNASVYELQMKYVESTQKEGAV